MNSTDETIEAAWRARREGRHDEAERGLRAAIETSRRAGAVGQQIDALGKLAHVLRDRGECAQALTLSEQAVTLSRGGDPLVLAHALRHLGDLHRDAERFPDADRCYSEALTLYRTADSPDPLDVANALRPAALLKAAQGDRLQARELLGAARALYQQAGIDAGVEECSRRIARLA